MHVTVRCPRCGKPLKAPQQMLGKRVRCAACEHEFDLIESSDLSGSSSLTGEMSNLKPGLPRDDTLSRSMLPVRDTGPVVPPDEMLCRLEPVTLRWLNATDAVEEFLGQTI